MSERRDRAIRHIGQVLFPIQPSVGPDGCDNGQIAEWLYDHGIRPRRWWRRELWHGQRACGVCRHWRAEHPAFAAWRSQQAEKQRVTR